MPNYEIRFDLPSYLRSKQILIDSEVDRAVTRFYPERLFDSMRYSLMAGGKRLRPALCLAGCEVAGGKTRTALPTACALEMLHTATLIHDDLPAIDNDDLRRGRMANHKVFGADIALLTGDALLVHSLEYILVNTPDVPAERLLRVVQILLHMMGVNGAVAGQVVDIESEGRDDIDLATLEFIHTHKTGAMLVASVVSGAVLAGADERAITLLSSYGEKIGLAFQIIDDILDATSTSERLGKPVRNDVKMQKATFPQLLGLDASRKRAAELIDAARADLAPLGDDATPLLALAEYIYSRSG